MYNVWWGSKKQGVNSKGLLNRSEWLNFINKFEKVKGRATFTKSHIYIFLKTAYLERKFVSRYILKDILNLSETSTRTFLKKMVELNVAKTVKGGHHLTPYGKRLANYIVKTIKEIRVSNEIPFQYKYAWGTAINYEFKKDRLYKLRDYVIRFGGEAALILSIKDDEIIFPESQDRLSDYNLQLAEDLKSKIKDFDAKFIIISFSNDIHKARLSSLETALTYIEEH